MSCVDEGPSCLATWRAPWRKQKLHQLGSFSLAFAWQCFLQDRLQEGPGEIRTCWEEYRSFFRSDERSLREVSSHEGFKDSHGFLKETLQAGSRRMGS